MASIGMAMHWANNAYEADRRQREDNQRYLAGRELFDSVMREATFNQQIQEEASSQSNNIRRNLSNFKSRINRGDKEALVEFYNAAYGNQNTAFALVDDHIIEVNPTTGEVIGDRGSLTDLTGSQMLAIATQDIPSAEQIANTYIEQTRTNIANNLELQKIMLQNEGKLAAADLTGRYGLAGAQAAANANMYGANSDAFRYYLQYLDNYNTAVNDAAASNINPSWSVGTDSVTGQEFFYDRTNGERVTPTAEQANQFQNFRRQIGSQGGLMQGIPLPLGVANVQNSNLNNAMTASMLGGNRMTSNGTIANNNMVPGVASGFIDPNAIVIPSANVQRVPTEVPAYNGPLVLPSFGAGFEPPSTIVIPEAVPQAINRGLDVVGNAVNQWSSTGINPMFQ